jgi:hypothetical protein
VKDLESYGVVKDLGFRNGSGVEHARVSSRGSLRFGYESARDIVSDRGNEQHVGNDSDGELLWGDEHHWWRRRRRHVVFSWEFFQQSPSRPNAAVSFISAS